MDYSSTLLGQRTGTQLRERNAMPVLRIGRDAFTRRDLASVDCFNFLAAAILSAAAKKVDAKDTKDLFHRVPPAALALPRVGMITLAVLGAAFEAKQLGTLDMWDARHRPKDARAVTFASVKHRELGEQRKEAAEIKTRKRRRQQTAHGIRAKRFLDRAARPVTQAADNGVQ